MSVTETNSTNINPRLAILVKKDDPEATDPEDTAIALISRDSIAIELNEENNDLDTHTRTDIITDPSTQNPQISFDKARSVSSDALEELGVTDADGNYQRGADRVWQHGAEVWYFETDADITSEDPVMKDEFGEVRWDVGSFEPDGNSVMYDVTGHIADSSNIVFGGGGA